VQFHAANKSWRFTPTPSIFAKIANPANKRSKFDPTFSKAMPKANLKIEVG